MFNQVESSEDVQSGSLLELILLHHHDRMMLEMEVYYETGFNFWQNCSHLLKDQLDGSHIYVSSEI